jgi:hypothetical protein
MKRSNVSSVFAILVFGLFAIPSALAQTVAPAAVAQKEVKMNWSTLMCFQESAASDKLFYVRGDDGQLYNMSSKEWDCSKYSGFFAFPSKQCDCILKSGQVVASTTGSGTSTAAPTEAVDFTANTNQASAPVGQEGLEQRQQAVLPQAPQNLEQPAEAVAPQPIQDSRFQNQPASSFNQERRPEQQQQVREDRRDGRQAQRDMRVDDRRNQAVDQPMNRRDSRRPM